MSEFDIVVDSLKSNNVFLTGGAGVGKSYLVKEIIEFYKKDRKNVVALGSTGIAAVNVGGYTVHSFFVFGISSDFRELKNYDKRNAKRIRDLNKILKRCDLLVIDEISMISADLLDMIYYRLKEAQFDGKILLVGDFFQLPPVRKKRDEKKDSLFDFLYAFESSAWNSLDPLIIELTSPKRATDREFVNVLKKLRVAECDDEVIEYLKRLLKKPKDVYKEDATVLFGTNMEASDYNEENLKKLKNPFIELESELRIEDESLTQKSVDNWLKNLPVEKDLRLKVDSKVIFTSNKKDLFYNGERATVISIEDGVVRVRKEDGVEVDVEPLEYVLSKISYDEKEDSLNEEVLASLRQYPLKSAYGITIHKSQGMSIDKLVCNVNNIFAKSQFYVALSRATDPKNLGIVYERGNFERYIKRVVEVSEKVKDFYKNAKILRVEEEEAKG